MSALEQIVNKCNGTTRTNKEFAIKCAIRSLRELTPNEMLEAANEIQALALQLHSENQSIKLSVMSIQKTS